MQEQQVGNGPGSKDGSWSNFPLMRSLSRSLSMPPIHQQIRPDSSSNSHSFHVVALTSSTYGALGSGIGDKFRDYSQSEDDEFDEEEQHIPSSAGNIPSSAGLRKINRVREPEVIEVWELLEDLGDDKSEDDRVHSVLVNKSHKRAKVAKSNFAKSTSMPVKRFRGDEPSRRELIHGLPVVLEKHRKQGVFQKVSPTKTQEAAKKPPLPPSASSRVRKGLFYGASLNLKQQQQDEADAVVTRSLSIDSRRSSGYCTPSEDLVSPSSSPGRGSEYTGWCLVDRTTKDEELKGNTKDEKYEDSRSSFRKSCVSSLDDEDDNDEVSSVMKPPQDDQLRLISKPQDYRQISKDNQQQKQGHGFLRDSTNLQDWQTTGELSFERRKPGLGLLDSFDKRCPPGGEDRVVLYFTSLQGIRKTYEQCKAVKMVLDGFFVAVDERDVSMHSEFREELKELVRGSVAPVPRLFVRGRYIGGAEEMLQLNENGMVAELFEGLPRIRLPRKVCDGCGGVRFIPCMECSGSCKIVDQEHDMVVRCGDCNENGLTRCPICY